MSCVTRMWISRFPAPADVLTPAPRSIPLSDAAALPLVGLTAWQALFEHAKLAAGQRVLVNGAGGKVGGLACSWPSGPVRT
ncbi:hypothetical protein ACIQWL_39150 [Streptomyces mirabilis]|uniref:hypothetical protein n=1 Tax=Streptomyces mirabilis TaxID=68239 RepID=UPI0033FB33BA